MPIRTAEKHYTAYSTSTIRQPGHLQETFQTSRKTSQENTLL